MFVITAFVNSMVFLINAVFGILNFIIIGRVVISWLGIEHLYNPLIEAIYITSEKILRPFRRFNLQIGLFDFTPVLAIIVIEFVRVFLVNILIGVAGRL